MHLHVLVMLLRSCLLAVLASLGAGCVGDILTNSAKPVAQEPQIGDAETFDRPTPMRPHLDDAVNLGVDPRPVAPDVQRTPGVLAGCEEVTAESAHCMALTAEGLAMVGLDTGRVCAGPAAQVAPNRGGSLGWSDDAVYLCAGGEAGPVLTRISLEDGFAERSATPCDAVTDHEGGLIAIPGTGDRLELWRTWDEVRAGEPPHVLEIAHAGTRIASVRARAYIAERHATSVAVADLVLRETRTVALAGFDGEIRGLDATEDGRLVVFGPAGLHVFDAETGDAIEFRSMNGVGQVLGISCR